MKSLNEIKNLNEGKKDFEIHQDTESMKRVRSITKQNGSFSLRDFDGYRNKKDNTYRFDISFPNTWDYVKVSDDNPDTFIIGGTAGKVYRTIPLKGTLYNNMSVSKFADELAKSVESEQLDDYKKIDRKYVEKAVRAYLELMND